VMMIWSGGTAVIGMSTSGWRSRHGGMRHRSADGGPRTTAGPGRGNGRRIKAGSWLCRAMLGVHSCGHSAGFPPASLLTAPAEPKLVGGTLIVRTC